MCVCVCLCGAKINIRLTMAAYVCFSTLRNPPTLAAVQAHVVQTTGKVEPKVEHQQH